jgi:hypothetical protein
MVPLDGCLGFKRLREVFPGLHPNGGPRTIWLMAPHHWLWPRITGCGPASLAVGQHHWLWLRAIAAPLPHHWPSSLQKPLFSLGPGCCPRTPIAGPLPIY